MSGLNRFGCLDFTKRVFLIFIILLISFSFGTNAQYSSTGPVEAEWFFSADKAIQGGQILFGAKFDIAENQHIFHHSYSYDEDFTYPLYTRLQSGDSIEIAGPFYTSYEIEKQFDTKVYKDVVYALFICFIPDGLNQDKADFQFEYGWQSCNDATGVCTPPVDKKENFSLTVSPDTGELPGVRNKNEFMEAVSDLEFPEKFKEAAKQELSWVWKSAAKETVEKMPSSIESDAVPEEAEGQFERIIRTRGSFTALLTLFFLGIAASFTPCVFPMIPITVAFFTRQGSEKKSKTLSLALVYVLGISITYSALGLFAAGAGETFGSYSNHPFVIVPLIVIFVILGFSLLGSFEFRLPYWLSSRVQVSGKKGYVGALLMGLALGFIAAPCVGPIILSLLLFIAKTGNYFLGFWGLFIFAWGMGLLFIVLALFSGAVNVLPKSGVWMKSVQRIFAFMIFAVAVYYTGKLFHNESVSRLLWGIFFTLSSVFFGLGSVMPEAPSVIERLKRGTAYLLIIAGALLVCDGMIGLNWIDLSLGTAKIGEPVRQEWLHYEKQIPDFSDMAVQKNKPLFLDFWATWCKNCRHMDKTTFEDERAKAALDDFILIKIQAESLETEGGRLLKDLLKSYYQIANVPTGLPSYIIIDSTGKTVSHRTGLIKPEQFIEWVRKYKS